MRERRALRFLVEALFLGALAVALVVADLEPLAIAGVMLLGWLVVALYEWAATRELPHYGRGLPPRYYVPQVSLPPPRQLEQLPSHRRSGYPAAGLDDQATWIATPAMRAEALSDWPLDPVAGPLPAPTPGEDTMVVDNLLLVAAGEELFHENTWIDLDPVAEGGTSEAEAGVALAEPEVEEPQVEEPQVEEPEPEAEPQAVVAEPEVDEPEPELPAEPEPEPELVAEPEPEPEPEPELVAEPEPEPEPEPVAVLPEPELEVEPAPVVAAVVVAELVDAPVVEPEVGRRWWRRNRPAAAAAVAASAVELAEEPEAPETEAESELEPAAFIVDEPEDVAEPEVEEETDEDVLAAPVEAPVQIPEPPARHTFDPLGDQEPSRRRWRRRDDPYVELPARPPRPIALPGTSRRN